MKRKKKTDRQKIIKKLDDKVRVIIRERDVVCQKCNKVFDKMDCSHVIPRGNKALRWDLNNLKLLCSGCHLWWWHQNPLEAMEWFKSKFPDRYEYLMGKRKEPIRPIKIFELRDLLEELNKGY